jgi:hypothetical protein
MQHCPPSTVWSTGFTSVRGLFGIPIIYAMVNLPMGLAIGRRIMGHRVTLEPAA